MEDKIWTLTYDDAKNGITREGILKEKREFCKELRKNGIKYKQFHNQRIMQEIWWVEWED